MRPKLLRFDILYTILCLIVNMQQSTAVTSHFPGSQQPEQWHHKTAAFHRDCKCHEQWGKNNTHSHLGYTRRKPRRVRRWRTHALVRAQLPERDAVGLAVNPSSQNHISLMAAAHGRPPASAVCQCPGSHRPKTNKHPQLDLHPSQKYTHTTSQLRVYIFTHINLWLGMVTFGRGVLWVIVCALLILNLAETRICWVKRRNCMKPKAAGMQDESIC